MALSPTKILVVDDEPEILALLNEWIGDGGHDIETAANGWDAFEIFLNQKPVLTITDLRMPGMDGFQLISRIRPISDALVIALSAMGGDEQDDPRNPRVIVTFPRVGYRYSPPTAHPPPS